MSLKRQLRIIALFHTATKVDRDRLKGILRFALQHPEWDVLPLPEHPVNRAILDKSKWTADGIITNEYTLLDYTKGDLSVWSKIKNLVIFDANSDRHFLPSAKQVNIDNDSAGCGQYAAEQFLNHGLRNLAYVHSLQPRLWSRQRAEAFRKATKTAGAECFIYQPSNHSTLNFTTENDMLATWLQNIPKPCGILGANDARAIQIIRLCNQLGISIPSEVAVMGVDNNEIEDSFIRPTLSTIEPDNEAAGYLAAQTMHKMISYRPVKSTHLIYRTRKFIERDSTYDPNGTARIINLARGFMKDYFRNDIDIDAVARAVGVSRRTLERRFADAKASPPATELRNLRLNEICRLLKETTMPINEVCISAGFKSTLTPQLAFRQTFHQTMSTYRQNHRPIH